MRSHPWTKRGRLVRSLVLTAAVVLVAVSGLLADDSDSDRDQATGWNAVRSGSKTRFPLSNNGDGFDFETDEIQGTIRLDGAYHGVKRLIDKRTEKQVIDERYSALNLYKLMSVNQAMDRPRSMRRTIRSTEYAVEVTWPQTETHKAEITARYEVSTPNAIDVTVTVRSHGSYRGYELFMSSYFDSSLRPCVYLKPRFRGSPQRVMPTVSDVFRDTVLVFPRDAHAARLCVDGRWDRTERKTPTVQMCPVRHYGHCLALQVASEQQLGVVLMAHPRHCYAISTRYDAQDDADRLTDYSAFDHSLFGNDLVPGDERTVVVRLALTPLDKQLSQPLKMYQAFVAEMDNQFR